MHKLPTPADRSPPTAGHFPYRTGLRPRRIAKTDSTATHRSLFARRRPNRSASTRRHGCGRYLRRQTGRQQADAAAGPAASAPAGLATDGPTSQRTTLHRSTTLHRNGQTDRLGPTDRGCGLRSRGDGRCSKRRQALRQRRRAFWRQRLRTLQQGRQAFWRQGPTDAATGSKSGTPTDSAASPRRKPQRTQSAADTAAGRWII